jgi:hypothetical protein
MYETLQKEQKSLDEVHAKDAKVLTQQIIERDTSTELDDSFPHVKRRGKRNWKKPKSKLIDPLFIR